MRVITITGRLVDDSKVMYTKYNTPYLYMRVANTENPSEQTYYFDVECYDTKVINNLTQYLTKGSGVDIVGKLSAKAYIKNDSTPGLDLRIDARMVNFHSLGSKKSNDLIVDGMEVSDNTQIEKIVDQEVQQTDDLPF